MRRENIVSIRREYFMSEFVAEIILIAPDANPNQIGVIIPKVNEMLKTLDVHTMTFEAFSMFNSFGSDYEIVISSPIGSGKKNLRNAIYCFVDYIVNSVEEIRQLNLTYNEWQAGMRDPDDESRPKFKFVTGYDHHDENSWKDDFIDLTALTQNVTATLSNQIDSPYGSDCFICAHQSTEKCKTCINNESYKDHYEGRRRVRGNCKTCCKFDCPLGRYICCEECNKKDTCVAKCEESIDTCGKAVYKDGKRVQK